MSMLFYTAKLKTGCEFGLPTFKLKEKKICSPSCSKSVSFFRWLNIKYDILKNVGKQGVAGSH